MGFSLLVPTIRSLIKTRSWIPFKCISLLAIQGKARQLPTSKANLPLPHHVEMHGY